MYFPVGWPKVLQGGKATGGSPVKIFRHKSRDLVIEIRSHSIAFWHTRLCVLISSYVRSKECVEKHGPNITAAIKADGSVMVVATAAGNLLFLRLQYEKVSNLNSQGPQNTSYSTRDHGILVQVAAHLAGAGEGREVEVVQVKHFHETAVVGGVLDLLCVGNQLMISTGYGVLHRMSWEGTFVASLAITLKQIGFANDLLPDSRGQPLGGETIFARQIVYSPLLHGFSVVLSDGRAGFLTGRLARYEPESMQGVWIKGLSDAVCTAVNPKYKLLAFGKTNGLVEVYSIDDSTGQWNLSHTLQFTRRQFPETGMELGEVQCIEWSMPMVVAVSWKNGGLSLWSVFGSLLLCSLGDQPGTPSPLNPHCTILESMCWSSDGYRLWMLPITGEKMTNQNVTVQNAAGGEGDGHVLVMQFMRNSTVTNPIASNHHHLFLQGSDFLYLNVSRSVTQQERTGTSSVRAGMVSSPQWRVIPLPASYMVLNWPIQYAAISESGCNLAVAGKAGFALYSSSKRKWKLFGNEVQEQGLICRGGLAWFHDILVFPCRYQEKSEEIRFYSLHSNLDNSQLLNQLKTTSPIIKLNLHNDLLLLASRDCHVTIIALKLEMLPNKGLVLTLSKLHEMNLTKLVPSPWIHTLVALIPSNIRTEPDSTVQSYPSHDEGDEKLVDQSGTIDSILFNISGKILMMQRERPNQFTPKEQVKEGEWSFTGPVCLAASVEIVWTPPLSPSSSSSFPSASTSSHLSESLWLACGWAGIKVWLPLFPRDEGHPSFLSKRIMLTLPCSAYPQVVMFEDAVLFGLSHETAFSEKSLSTRNSFPFATIERTTNIFLHHILRQLLRRNLGSHALQIARGFSHLPYFSHVLELMLHEILEEEAPGAMPVPDALLPRVVEFIKQFPEFLETVGHCARKTEVALWQYLFAAVGNPRDLFEWCITDGRLQIAATYLIIIQNLETPSVSRQLATRLLDAALETNSWSLCRDLVRFLRAIGPGDTVESPLATTPLKAQTPNSAVFSSAGGTTPLSAAPDLDRSAVLVARDHLTSGSTSSSVSLSGDYKDASGKVIRRPHFMMDVHSKEDYFIELILSRHARKLLTAHALRDLGCFAAHLDFSLSLWLSREKTRAAKADDFPFSLQELHKEFQWPFPPPCSTHQAKEPLSASDEGGPLFSPTSTVKSNSHTPKEGTTPTKEGVNMCDMNGEVPDRLSNEGAEDVSKDTPTSFRRAHRPPDLNLSPSKSREQEQQHSVTLEPSHNTGTDSNFDPTRSSTPTNHSGTVSEKVSLVMKQNPSSLDLNLESSSLGETMEESDWDLNSEVAVTTGAIRGSSQAEKEIRYFAEVMLEAGCVDWTFLLSLLLLDRSLLSRSIENFTHTNGHLVDRGVLTRNLKGMEDIRNWAESECSGYLPFLDSIQTHLDQLDVLSSLQDPTTSLPPASGVQAQPLPTQEGEETDAGESSEGSRIPRKRNSSSTDSTSLEDNSSTCVLS